jgi:leucyl-tRNA synthetase
MWRKRRSSDIKEILRVTGITPSKIFLYTSPEWKSKVFAMAVRMAVKGELSIPNLTKAAMADPDIRSKGKDAANFARRMAEDITKRSDQDMKSLLVEFDEIDYLNSSRDFIESQLGCEVFIRAADDKDIHDPEGKAKVAQPRRPAIFVE